MQMSQSNADCILVWHGANWASQQQPTARSLRPKGKQTTNNKQQTTNATETRVRVGAATTIRWWKRIPAANAR